MGQILTAFKVALGLSSRQPAKLEKGVVRMGRTEKLYAFPHADPTRAVGFEERQEIPGCLPLRA